MVGDVEGGGKEGGGRESEVERGGGLLEELLDVEREKICDDLGGKGGGEKEKERKNK